jgi:hypothetical protein
MRDISHLGDLVESGSVDEGLLDDEADYAVLDVSHTCVYMDGMLRGDRREDHADRPTHGHGRAQGWTYNVVRLERGIGVALGWHDGGSLYRVSH